VECRLQSSIVTVTTVEIRSVVVLVIRISSFAVRRCPSSERVLSIDGQSRTTEREAILVEVMPTKRIECNYFDVIAKIGRQTSVTMRTASITASLSFVLSSRSSVVRATVLSKLRHTRAPLICPSLLRLHSVNRLIDSKARLSLDTDHRSADCSS
jgi:hypothetical protein